MAPRWRAAAAAAAVAGATGASASAFAPAAPVMTLSAAAAGVTLSPGAPVTLFNFTVPPWAAPPAGPGGCLTYLRVESGDFLWPAYDNARVAFFVDGEHAPSVDFRLGFADEGDTVPWGAPLVGNTGASGGVYVTVRAPFGSSLVATAALGEGDTGTHTINFVARGTVGVPFAFAGGALPPPGFKTARLKTASVDGVTAAPGAATQLLASAAPGALALVGLRLTSTNMSYTTGPVTAVLDGAAAPLSHDLPSFLAADGGFGVGKYATPIGGITALAPLLGAEVLGWRAFDADVVAWGGNATVSWTNGRAGAAGPTAVWATAFFYEFAPG